MDSYGYDVTVAANGRQTLKLFLSRKIDAVLTDMEMPGMTGVELATRLKRLRPELPVLLVTGTDSALHAPPESFDAAVVKGTSLSKLVHQLETILRTRSQHPVPLRPSRFLPLGSILTSIAVGAYIIPKLLK